MQITDIQFEKVSFSFEQPMKVAFAEIKDIETLLVKIDTDEGLSGFGEAAPLPFVTGDNLDSAWAVGRDCAKLFWDAIRQPSAAFTAEWTVFTTAAELSSAPLTWPATISPQRPRECPCTGIWAESPDMCIPM